MEARHSRSCQNALNAFHGVKSSRLPTYAIRIVAGIVNRMCYQDSISQRDVGDAALYKFRYFCILFFFFFRTFGPVRSPIALAHVRGLEQLAKVRRLLSRPSPVKTGVDRAPVCRLGRTVDHCLQTVGSRYENICAILLKRPHGRHPRFRTSGNPTSRAGPTFGENRREAGP